MGSPPVRAYATSDDEVEQRPTYRVGDEPLPFSDDPRLAACDVLILAFTARRHAEHLATVGTCPPDVAERIVAELDRIRQIVAGEPGSPGSPHVGACRGDAARGNRAPPSLFGGTERNGAKRVQADETG